MKKLIGCLRCNHADIIRDRFNGVMNGYSYCFHPDAKNIKEAVHPVYIFELPIPPWCPEIGLKVDKTAE